MMTGIVTAGLQAKLDIEVLGSSGTAHTVEMVIDTGFDGELVLPRTIIAVLGLNLVHWYPAMMADGTRVALKYYQGVVVWHGRPRTVEVLESGTVALRGMELLQGSRLTVDAAPGGAVIIEELP
jgi:clan AA aspartic protease